MMTRIGLGLGAAAVAMAVCTPATAQEAYPLRDAVECRPRGGLPNVFEKLQAGATVRIAYLGGSITAQPGWRPKTLAWFRSTFPDSTVSEIHAAIGGTGSDLGVYRLGHDVLRHEPDLLFVEFAVNDGGAAPERIVKAMEGIVRQTWRADPRTDICFVYTLTEKMLGDLQGGKYPRAASVMESVADAYGIPSIHMGLEVARMAAAGTVVFKAPRPRTVEDRARMAGKVLFSGDGVHPYTDGGHDLYLAAIVRSMPAIRAAGTPAAHALRTPLREDNWETATMVALSAARPADGWTKLPDGDGMRRRFGNRMPELWRADEPGTALTFSFRGTAVAIYDLLGPNCGQVIVRVDDGEPRVAPRFDPYCTYHRLSKLTVASGLPEGVHTVSLEIHPDQPDKLKILHRREANRGISELDPTKFDGTAWYAGAILLLGEMSE